MTNNNLYELPKTVTIAYYDVETDQNLTFEEYRQLHLANSEKIKIINKGGSNFRSEKEICGPSDSWYDPSTGNWFNYTVTIREFRLKVKITGGTWWYYTNDKASGVGGESSWWDSCGFFTKITQFDLDSQWRTDQMLIKNIHDARKTLSALNNGKIIVVNAWGCDSDNSRIVKRNTIKNIERAIEKWERGESVDMDATA